MKKLSIFFFVMLYASGFSQISWLTLNEAISAQKTNPKKILIDFYANWCSQCKMMDQKTFANPAIYKFINENYYAVKFDAEGNDKVILNGRTFTNEDFAFDKKKNSMHGFTRYLNVNAVPSIVFLDEKDAPITILQGSLTAKELEPYLILLAGDEYIKINTREKWENYRKKFKSKIKD